MQDNNEIDICAIIPARGGSKGVKNKNIKLLNGIPLIAHTIKAGMSCADVDLCVVSTDSDDIAAVAKKEGVEVIMRPASLARDTSRSEDVVIHVLDALALRSCYPKHVVLLQPTSPLRSSQHISTAISKYRSSGAASCISVTECEHHPYKCFIQHEDGGIGPFRDVRSLSAPRQSLPRVLRQNGAIYIINVARFRFANSFYIEPVVFYQMKNDESLDIDHEVDFAIAEILLGKVSV